MPFRDNSRHFARFWWTSAKSSIIREMEFRANFLLGLLRQVGWSCAYIFMISIIFRNTHSLAGWNQAEVLTIFALSRILEGLINIFYSHNIMQFPGLVQNGMFDYILTKPLPAQLHMAFRRIDIDLIGNVVMGSGILAYAFSLRETATTLSDWGLFIFLAALGLTVFYALLIVVSSLVFWLERLEALYAFNNLFTEPLPMPFDIFPRRIRFGITYILPLAFVVFVPAQALTGRLALWQIPIAIGLTVVFLILANMVWQAGLRRYTSASS